MLIVVLTSITLYQTMAQGFVTIFIYAIGLSIPLIVISYAGGVSREEDQEEGKHERRTRQPYHRWLDHRDRDILPVPCIPVTRTGTRAMRTIVLLLLKKRSHPHCEAIKNRNP